MPSCTQLSIALILLFVPANVISLVTDADVTSQLTDLNTKADHIGFDTDNNTFALQQATLAQLSAWRSVPQFAELAGKATDVDTVLSSLHLYSAALIVVPGNKPPDRPTSADAQPFLTLLQGLHMEALSSMMPLLAINKAAATAAAVMGRPLYPFRLLVEEFNKSGSRAPWAIYHVPSGTVYLDQQLVKNVQELPDSMDVLVKEFAERMFDHLLGPSSAASDQTIGASGLGQIFGTAAAAAAGLTLASQVPLWFCIGCPIVLGMLFPFAFNFGLAAIADELCTHYNLPADECTQLWYSAFALAMILSFASVIPIVSICRLAQCAKSSPAPSS